MIATRLSLVLVALATAAVVAPAALGGAPARPAGLKAFLLTTSEPDTRTFPRTPSFAWKPVRGAVRYEFQLATSARFNDGSVVWSNVDPNTELAPGTTPDPTAVPGSSPTTPAPTTPGATPATGTTPTTSKKVLRSPAVSVDVALPWITGEPYGLYARVRAVLRRGATGWSKAYGFNVRWRDVPAPQPTVPGLLRWSTVDGATAYEVWIFGAKRTFMTTTNVADQRELYSFHQSAQWTSKVQWRVRAQRILFGDIPNGLPAVSHGPWSPVYTSFNPPFAVDGDLGLTHVISDVVSSVGHSKAHQLTPAYAWHGTGPAFAGVTPELWRVYVATDKDCVNVVYRGAIVGGPAYAPRSTGPLALPHGAKALDTARNQMLDSGTEGDALMLDGTKAVSSEEALVTSTTATPPTQQSGSTTARPAAKVDLWDTAWPTGGYYWTVVPVVMEQIKSSSDETNSSSNPEGGSFRYREIELPQDACQAGRVMRFGKSSSPVVTGGGAPYVSGLSPNGRLTSASRRSPSFYGAPLVAWEPALGANEYEIQWSRKAYPWKRAGTITTPSTSALLPIASGTWYYRVRGLNYSLPRKPEMAWSTPVGLRSAKPVFAVVR